jgi:cytochrome P450
MSKTISTSLPIARGATNPFAPADEFERLRAEEPVVRIPLPGGEFVWLVTRNADVRQVLGDPRFSNKVRSQSLLRPAPGADTPDIRAQQGVLIGYDPPEHTRLRRMIAGEFTVRRMRRLLPRVEAIVTDHLDAMEQAGPPVDLVQAFAQPVASLMICELLGVPYADRAAFQRRGRMTLDLTLPEDQSRAVLAETLEYMSDLVAKQRRDPGEELLGMLVREHGTKLTDAELIGVGNVLLLAGHETTANMLSLGTLLLLRNPEQLAMVRDDPEVVNQAVEELLRYLTIVSTGALRRATEDVTLGSQVIKAGDYVRLSLPSANRDETAYENADQFDVTRKASTHVAFGHGLHHCIGAPLARMQMRIAYPALVRRFPTLSVAVPFEEVRFRTESAIYGLHELPVAW